VLTRFVLEDWTPGDVLASFAAWKAARAAWVAEHYPLPGAWTPLGDGLSRIRTERATRRRLDGMSP
jgi:hypothetical protein